MKAGNVSVETKGHPDFWTETFEFDPKSKQTKNSLGEEAVHMKHKAPARAHMTVAAVHVPISSIGKLIDDTVLEKIKLTEDAPLICRQDRKYISNPQPDGEAALNQFIQNFEAHTNGINIDFPRSTQQLKNICVDMINSIEKV